MLYQHPANAIIFDPPFSFVLFTRERDRDEDEWRADDEWGAMQAEVRDR
jgi:hypothetical protein